MTYSVDDRGPFPKNLGDRKHHNGDEITLEASDALDAGQWAVLNGDGTITGLDDDGSDDPPSIDPSNGHVVLKHAAEPNEKVAVHAGGVVLARNVGPGVKVDEVTVGDGSSYPLVQF